VKTLQIRFSIIIHQSGWVFNYTGKLTISAFLSRALYYIKLTCGVVESGMFSTFCFLHFAQLFSGEGGLTFPCFYYFYLSYNLINNKYELRIKSAHHNQLLQFIQKFRVGIKNPCVMCKVMTPGITIRANTTGLGFMSIIL